MKLYNRCKRVDDDVYSARVPPTQRALLLRDRSRDRSLCSIELQTSPVTNINKRYRSLAHQGPSYIDNASQLFT